MWSELIDDGPLGRGEIQLICLGWVKVPYGRTPGDLFRIQEDNGSGFGGVI